MSGRDIAVVGGSGFIGTCLVRRLLEAGHRVRIGDRATSDAYPELWVHCDIRERDTLAEVLEGADVVYHLAAEHRDNVRPTSLYDDVNVEGTRNVCRVAEDMHVGSIVFASSVAIYGLAAGELDESAPAAPFNDYGRTKWEAEGVLREWQQADAARSLVVIRPTVIFGENNRGNVYNLFRQIAEGPFLMIGDGTNKKSMAYVENVAGFLEYALSFGAGVDVFNYVDKPDFDMNTLVRMVGDALGRRSGFRMRIPFGPAYAVGCAFDVVARASRRPLPISSIRIKKFCSSTVFSSRKALATGYRPPVPLEQAVQKTIEFEFKKATGG